MASDLRGLRYCCQNPYCVPPKYRALALPSSPVYEFQSDLLIQHGAHQSSGNKSTEE